jgi:HD-GYP domain-containing protein (c-di-GMP phosphodiesterase class II)
VPTTPAAPRPKTRHSQEEHAHAFAIVLCKEFGVGFRFFDAVSGAPIDIVLDLAEHDSVKVLPMTDLPPPTPRSAAEVRREAEDGQTSVRLIAPARFELALTLYQGGRPTFLAVGVYPGLAQAPADAERERTALAHWLQSFSDRLRLSDQFRSQHVAAEEQSAQARGAWEGLLSLDHLMRRMRVHKDPSRHQQRVLETAHGLLGAQAVVCVPPDPQLPVVMHGEPLLAAIDCVHLAGLLAKTPGYDGSGPLFCNRAETQCWALSFPQVTSLLAMPICEQDAPGWVIAVNKIPRDESATPASSRGVIPFRKSDAALLMPLVALLRLHHTANVRFQDLKELMVGLARSLTAAIDAKDSYTFGHSERVARIAVELGRALEMDGDALSDLYLAGLLHDVGKIGIPDALLQKPGPLTDAEYDMVKQHVRIGYSILAGLRPIRHLLLGVLHHHERYDGKGYPDGLAGETIPLLARVLAVADAYDAMSANRPYRMAMSAEEVERRLRQGAGTQWDAQVIDAFERCRQKVHAIRQRGVGESLRQALDGAMRNSNEPSTHVV